MWTLIFAFLRASTAVGTYIAEQGKDASHSWGFTSGSSLLGYTCWLAQPTSLPISNHGRHPVITIPLV